MKIQQTVDCFNSFGMLSQSFNDFSKAKNHLEPEKIKKFLELEMSTFYYEETLPTQLIEEYFGPIGSKSYELQKVNDILRVYINHPDSTPEIRRQYIEKYFEFKEKYPSIYYDIVVI